MIAGVSESVWFRKKKKLCYGDVMKEQSDRRSEKEKTAERKRVGEKRWNESETGRV